MLMCLVPGAAFAADRNSAGARVGVNRVAQAGVRGPNAVNNLGTAKLPTMTTTTNGTTNSGGATPPPVSDSGTTNTDQPAKENCRDAYRACMDEFCLLDESEGYRCACSSNINKSKSLIQEIQRIQAEADSLYTEGVERAQLGAKAKLVFGESEAAKKSSRASGLSFSEWLKGSTDDADGELGADEDIGDGLYAMASEMCKDTLQNCDGKADMEEMLYSRMIVQDCKSFEVYLADQKVNANANKRTAEAAVRKAKLEMLDTTDKYNRGECLLAYRSCIADKGGCGSHFENCLDKDLLGRRAYACENVLDQCMASREYVLKDWEAEAESILVEAAKYSERNSRLTCLARIQSCLEEGCSTSTNPMCLTDVKVAAGVCPVITECETMIPGIQSAVNDKLGYLRVRFCQNDVDKCLQEKCGTDFTAPECLGKSSAEIVEMCPQSMFPSCKNEAQFDIIVQAVLLQMDYQLLQGCVNYFGEQLGRVCGTDMACLPNDDTVEALMEIPETDAGMTSLRNQVRENSRNAVDEFFVQFEKDKTVTQCADVQKPAGRQNLGVSVFNSAKMIAQIGAENRALRELESKVAELSRKQDLKKAEENCYNTYKIEQPDNSKAEKSYTYIRSVSFEPNTRNCHVCRIQQVCEVGGQKKSDAILQQTIGSTSAMAASVTSIMPGWGTAIGGAVGMLGGIFGGSKVKRETFCQQLEACEDVNM